MTKKMLCTVAVAIVLCSTPKLFAQTYSKGHELKKADVNFTELAKYYKEHPLPLVRKAFFDEDEGEESKVKHVKADPDKVHVIHRLGSTGTDHPVYAPLLPVSPAPVDTFQATLSSGTSIPPDTHGDVDSQYCITAVNTDVKIQTRVGGLVSNVSIDGFWSALLTSGPGAFDPRVHYDPYYKRWIMVADAYGELATSQIMIAVSATSDPTGTWHMYSVLIDGTGASWLDFPCVGFNSKWITVTGNLFPNGSAAIFGAVAYVFDYASIMAGTGAPYTKITESSSFTLCPALTYDFTEPNMYALEINNAGTGKLQLWKITGAVGSETITSIGFPTTTQHWHNGGSADFVPQVGTTNKLQAGDDRITRVVYRNHDLWCAHTVFLPDPGTTSRCSVMWWQIDTTAVPIQNGLIDDATTPTFYDYPSIAVNAANDVLLGFGNHSSFMHPSAGYALHLHTDPADSMRPPVVFRHGQATYYQTFGGTQDRWGDYSATTVDPRNDTDFWTIQESVPASPANFWDTWWANVQICVKPVEPVMAITAASQCAGSTQLYAINPIAGATSYEWMVSGTGWSGSSTTDSINITSGTGNGVVTVLAFNACGQGAANTFTITPHALPGTPAITTVTPACIGLPNAVFSATSSGASTYSWQTLGAGWSGTSTSTSLTSAVGTGTGTVICTTTNACGSTSDTIQVVPAVVPTVSFSETTHVIGTGAGDVLTFTGTAPAGSTYTWSFGGGTGTPGTGAGPQTDVWLFTGLKTVTLTVTNDGCTATYSDTVLVVSNTGIGQLTGDGQNVSILPNPNDGVFDVVFTKAVSANVSVKIFDMQGRTVYSDEFATKGNKVPVVTRNLPSGTYTVSIAIDGDVVNKKITIAK